jgi:DNA-binding GntR family transcriptional regulator
MIFPSKLKKGQRLFQERVAPDFRVSRVTAAIAFSELKKHRLVIVKRGVGSFVA